MQLVRPDNSKTRFAQSLIDAEDRVNTVAGEVEGLSKVAVFKFFGSSMVPETTSPDGTGFVSPFDAITAIRAATVTDDVTPLANSMCAAIDAARGSGTGATTTRFLEVFTDGAENNSIGLPCAGPFSVFTNVAPFDAGSWQNLVYLRTTNPLPAIQVDPTLYHDETGAFAFAKKADLEGAKLAALGRSPASTFAVGLAAAATDVDLFSALAADTGGTFTEVVDTAPVPVVGDLDGDFDVDRNDAIALARKFGSAATPALDLNGDNKIGFGDYALLLARFGTGSGTPAPDPYTPSPVINCIAGTVTLDGKVIENGGITINTTGACRVIIKNSLIVSGAAAIKVLGTAIFEIDNSIIVGEAQWLNSTGASVVSAANTVFHGARRFMGALVILDRGGNTFEQ